MANHRQESPAVAASPPGEAAAGLADLVEVIAALREHCPWMGALTHASLVEYLLEEAHETAETIESGGADDELRDELGDVLLQVVLHARLAEERGVFALPDVVRGLTAKMVRRNPHVFRPDGTLQDSFPAGIAEIEETWDQVKKAEMPDRNSVFAGIPEALPALARARKALDRAERAGVAVPVPEVSTADTEEELGRFLLGVVGSARAKGLDAERALRGAIRGVTQDHLP